MSKLFTSFIVGLAAAVLCLPAMAAIVSGNMPASNAWYYTDYQVKRLNFSEGVDGPISIGEHVLVAVPTGDTNYRDVYFLRDGGYVKVDNVPDYVISEANYTANDSRFVWTEQVELDTYYYNLIELDPATGTKTTLLSDMFFNGAESVAVHVTGDDYYFTSTINFNDRNGSVDAEIYWYDPLERAPMVVDQFNDFTHEQMQDAREGVLLTKVTFEGGEEQLWLYDGDEISAIPDSWTESHEDIEAAHFLTNGQIEFFRMYERCLFDPATGATETTGDYLSWKHDLAGALQLVNQSMAWLDSESDLHLSIIGDRIDMGQLGATGIYRLDQDCLFYDNDGQGTIYWLTDGETTELDFIPTDIYGDAIVGNDDQGNIIYNNSEYDLSLTLGYGGTPLISDATHVYWIGVDEKIYEATLDATLFTGEETIIKAVKTAQSDTVYLIDGKNKYVVPNEKVFYSYFNDFSIVETVTQAKLSEYVDAGEARLAIGARVKLADDPKVYVVGYDGKLHWIISQAVASDIYGSVWNQNIIEINLMDLVDYSFGTNVVSATDVNVI